MDVFLIGNGFDLHYDLPTSYACFLLVMKRLCEKVNEGETITSVYQVLCDSELLKIGQIKRCIDRYGTHFDAALDPVLVQHSVDIISDNMWFNYFLECFDMNGEWVDFEREIGRVINAFELLLRDTTCAPPSGCFNRGYNPNAISAWNICSKFPFFFDEDGVDDGKEDVNIAIIYERFVIEKPQLSNQYVLDCQEIVKELFISLTDLSLRLELYLEDFVDAPVRNMASKGVFNGDEFLATNEWYDTHIVSFNYTHTLDAITRKWAEKNHKIPVCYIHGELRKNNVVLGVNSDQRDEHDELELTFLVFKKYFQRVYNGTDTDYLRLLTKIEEKDSFKNYTLYVIGHSLDVTDTEVIRECFKNAGRIIVFNYNLNDVEQHIRNLVTIFGKKEFDRLRLERKLTFVALIEMKLSAFEFAQKYLN